MDVGQENRDWNCIENEYSAQLFYPGASGVSDADRDPELLPRIGEQYQVDIPPLLKKPEYLYFMQNPFPNTYDDFSVGLPVSLMWIEEDVKNIEREPKEVPGDLSCSSTTKESIKYESIREVHNFPEPSGTTLDAGIYRKAGKSDLQEGPTYMHRQHRGKDYRLVPGSAGSVCDDLEKASFLLGLYIFGKNLVQVKKFVGSKKMGDILSFYYGKFYRSDSYNRWSECRKIRSRRCIYGQRIFTGSTQQELLSRLFLHVSDECQNTLTEVTKKFGEGKMLLEEYVFALKASVGINALVEAVGIGKGKQDLTGMVIEPLKFNQVAPVLPEIPVGKACAALTPLEIINFLTGGYRLSKARSSDLFWEAVWPRLLARGWHSEQPNDHSFFVASRHSLVFLIPGIKKFSRRKLVKGEHYFDSVSDVLNKVAMDPALLNLDTAEDKGCGGNEENGWIDEKFLDQGEFPVQQRHLYLKPRTPSRSRDVLQFTIVDTSLATGETNRVRELRSLPAEMMNVSLSKSDSDESDDDYSADKETRNEFDSSDNLCIDLNKTDIPKSTMSIVDKRVFSSERDNFENNDLEHSSTLVGPGFPKVSKKSVKEHNTGKYDDTQRRKPAKEGHASRKAKHGDRNLLPPVSKRRRRIAACNKASESCRAFDALVDPRFSYLDQHQTKTKLSSTNSSPRGSLNIADECTLGFSNNSSVAEHSSDKSESRTLIDLNLPLPQDAETETSAVEMTQRIHDQTSEQLVDSCALKTSTSSYPTSEQSTCMNSRRQSTRNRPLTTKALEALACGFLSMNPKRRERDDDYLLGNSISRPSRRARSRMKIAENYATGVIDFEGNERANVVFKDDGDILSEL